VVRVGTLRQGETWEDVLIEGRGTVGETVLHLAFLLNSPACRRLIYFLAPWLADKQTTDAFGHKVCQRGQSGHRRGPELATTVSSGCI